MPRRSPQPSVAQSDMFGGLSRLRTKVISRRGDFESLFEGFTRLRAVSYVVSPDVLLEYFDRWGYEEIQVVVGDSLSESYRRDLERKGVSVADRLADLVETGSLRVYIPARLVHTKFYILETPEKFRVIQTSANFTATAQEARRQVNYAWYLDLPPGDPILDRLVADYEAHAEGCSLFMDDLVDLLKRRPDGERERTITAWLKGGVADEQDTEIRDMFHALATSAVDSGQSEAESVAVLRLPDSALARKRVAKYLAPMKPIPLGRDRVSVGQSAFVRYVYQTHGVPLLVLSKESHDMMLGMDGRMMPLTEKPSEPEVVSQALGHLEEYLATVDSAESPDPAAAKASMFEALLYLFSSPFAHEYMKARRNRFGQVDTRGPRYLYIYGPTQNGKSTFLRFVLRLMTRRGIEPLSRRDFTRTRLLNAAMTETAFPLVFDDVDPSRTHGMEDVFKSYWERWWRNDHVYPQILVTSNSPSLKDWAKSRVKRVDFDVHFTPDEMAREKLARIFAADIPVFPWFAYLYARRLDSVDLSSDDELKIGRSVIQDLYSHAGRALPWFFPPEPVEKLHDPGRKDWIDALFHLQKAAAKEDRDRTLVTFSGDMQPWEISHYVGYLPQTIKHKRRGRTIIIENPAAFEEWLGKSPRPRGPLGRLFRG